jgi:hypothetical protein
MVSELCKEVGLDCVQRSPDEIALNLEPGVTLLFQNAPADDDCLVGFEGTPWHTHDGLICSDRHGYYVELSYLDLVSSLADGTVLLCELWKGGVLADRWLVHKDFVDESRYMQDGDEIRIRPVPRRSAVTEAPAEAGDA